jgi:hypothetical protein
MEENPGILQMITIVSGLPRSGTSMLMQVLQSGGMPLLTDQIRQPDLSNPRGYFEFEPVKELARDASWIGLAEGKAVKIIAQLLKHLPPKRDYRILFMQRPLAEVLDSQHAMLERLGKAGRHLTDREIGLVFERHLEEARNVIAARAEMQVLEIDHHELIRNPHTVGGRIANFLSWDLDLAAMARAVDPSLYRQRAAGANT